MYWGLIIGDMFLFWIYQVQIAIRVTSGFSFGLEQESCLLSTFYLKIKENKKGLFNNDIFDRRA